MAYKYPPPQAGHLFVMCIVSFAVQKHFRLMLSHWFLFAHLQNRVFLSQNTTLTNIKNSFPIIFFSALFNIWSLFNSSTTGADVYGYKTLVQFQSSS